MSSRLNTDARRTRLSSATCTCPPFGGWDEWDGPDDYGDACRDCPKHGTAVTA